MRLQAIALGIAVLLALGAQSVRAAQPTAVDAEIRRLVLTEMEGASKHEIDKTMSVYAPGNEMVLYDAAPGSFIGYDAVKAAYLKYFTGFPGLPTAKLDE